MRFTYVIHILTGLLGLALGAVALSSAKGAPLHRKSGILFVYTMLTMCFFGVLIAGVRGAAPELNIPAGLMTAYLVTTGFITVRPPFPGSRSLGIGLMALAMVVALFDLTLGFDALVNGGTRKGIPAFPYFMFGTVGMLASVSDFQVVRTGALRGSARLARHLWRMCFALFVAAMSFFIGQADEFPKALRIVPLLALPSLAVLVTMVYWLWRLRARPAARPALQLRPDDG